MIAGRRAQRRPPPDLTSAQVSRRRLRPILGELADPYLRRQIGQNVQGGEAFDFPELSLFSRQLQGSPSSDGSQPES